MREFLVHKLTLFLSFQFLRFSSLPVPKFIGNCGLYLMESYGGATLDSFYKSDVKQRLTIAKNILIGGLSLTSGFEGLKIYLTDATRDNIAVDEETLEVTFIDLDDVIIQTTDLKEDIHRHRRIECDNCFAYSTDAICGASISDINIYTICQVGLKGFNYAFKVLIGMVSLFFSCFWRI